MRSSTKTPPTTLADIEVEQARLAAEAERLREQADEARRVEHARQEKERDERAE